MAAEPGWKELRAVAGDLVYHVRYLTMPRHTLKTLASGRWSSSPSPSPSPSPSCLLTREELDRLLRGDARGFPAEVGRRRRSQEGGAEEGHALGKRHRCVWVPPGLRVKDYLCPIAFLVGLLLLFLFGCIYLPVSILLDPSKFTGEGGH